MRINIYFHLLWDFFLNPEKMRAFLVEITKYLASRKGRKLAPMLVGRELMRLCELIPCRYKDGVRLFLELIIHLENELISEKPAATVANAAAPSADGEEVESALR